MGEAKRERERERVAGKRLVDAGTRGTRERKRREATSRCQNYRFLLARRRWE